MEHRVESLYALLASCTVCPRDCGNDRLANVLASCASGLDPVVSSYTPHFGEEPALSGTRGAGNVFFGNCNLRCVYCQNWQISQDWKGQRQNEVPVERLAEMLLELQGRGCHNIGFVSPTHYAPQMAKAVLLAARAGLRLPIVYNTNAYDSVEVLRLLDGIVDIYLPDFKYADSASGWLYSKVPDYAGRTRQFFDYRARGAVLRNTEDLIERYQPLVAKDADGSLKVIGVSPEQAAADLTRVARTGQESTTGAGDGTGNPASALCGSATAARGRAPEFGVSSAALVSRSLELVASLDALPHVERTSRGNVRWHQQCL